MQTLTPRRVLPRFAQVVAAPTNGPHPDYVRLPQRLAAAPPHRQQEYLAGRSCAAEALRLAGAPDWSLPIDAGADGEPLWPEGYTGSITHTRGLATAAVATTSEARALGLDIELIVDPAQMARVSRVVLHACETRLKAAGLDAAAVFTLAFSGKESLFKCLYPLVRRRFDYRDAALRRIDVERHQIEIELLTSLAPGFFRGRRFVGRFDVEAGMVSTGFCIPQDEA